MVGDKVYLADKPTLDRVDATTADTKGKVGTTVDVGGSASAGSVLGKLNAVIAYLLGHVTTALSSLAGSTKRLNDLLTDARVAKIDTIDTNVATTKGSAYNAEMNSYQAALNTATNNAASATGTLSQKLSKVIADVAALQAALSAKGVVKSIQRVVMGGIDNVNDNFVIPIATVNPAKCSVRFENRVHSSLNGSFGPYFISLTANALTVKRPLSSNTVEVAAMWEIIEFY